MFDFVIICNIVIEIAVKLNRKETGNTNASYYDFKGFIFNILYQI